MTELEQLHSRLLLRQPLTQNTSPDKRLRACAVLLPIFPSKNGLQLLMIKRASHLRHHPNQIAFAGGKRDPQDHSLWHTALRETSEELGISHKLITQICALPQINTMTGFQITPFVGFLSKKPTINAHQGEVQAVLQLPLLCLLNPDNYSHSYHKVKNNRHQITWVKAQQHMIWGATAKILQELRLMITD